MNGVFLGPSPLLDETPIFRVAQKNHQAALALVFATTFIKIGLVFHQYGGNTGKTIPVQVATCLLFDSPSARHKMLQRTSRTGDLLHRQPFFLGLHCP
jgi:hypothetical protein